MVCWFSCIVSRAIPVPSYNILPSLCIMLSSFVAFSMSSTAFWFCWFSCTWGVAHLYLWGWKRKTFDGHSFKYASFMYYFCTPLKAKSLEGPVTRHYKLCSGYFPFQQQHLTQSRLVVDDLQIRSLQLQIDISVVYSYSNCIYGVGQPSRFCLRMQFSSAELAVIAYGPYVMVACLSACRLQGGLVCLIWLLFLASVID